MYQVFKYDHSIVWVNGDQQVSIPPNSISMVRIDSAYTSDKNMPIIIIKMSLSKILLDKIILNKQTATMILKIDKFIDKELKFNEKYIHAEFKYFTLKDINYGKDIDFQGQPDTHAKDVYSSAYIGLMKIDHVNMLKQYVNTIYHKATKMDIVVINTRHMNMVIEPFQGDNVLPQLIIPPTDSIAKLINYLDCISNLYKTPYLFFIDFEYTYLLSTSGKGVKIDSSIDEVIININNPAHLDSKIQGIAKDEKNKVYILDVSADDTSLVINNSKQESYNTIVGISSNGKTRTVKVKNNNTKTVSPKYKIVKVDEENLNKIDHLKASVEMSLVGLKIVKHDIDISIFTPNKRYMINHVSEYKEYNGLYLLESKAETHVKNNGAFSMIAELIFRKIQP